MNDFSDLESELKKLRPAAVSDELSSRVARALAQPESATPSAGLIKPRRIAWNWLPLGLGLAAAAIFLLLARVGGDRAPRAAAPTIASAPQPDQQRDANAEPARAFVPSGLTQVVYDTRDEGVHFMRDSDTPVRRVRSRKRETLQWHNPKTGASLQVTYPTEEVTLIPAGNQ